MEELLHKQALDENVYGMVEALVNRVDEFFVDPNLETYLLFDRLSAEPGES